MRILNFLAERREYLILALMLEFLHGAIWVDFGSPLSRSLMLIHLGLFVIWQPVWRGDQKIATSTILTFALLTGTFIFWMTGWLLFAWLILLIGLCAGRVAVSHSERGIYLLVLIFLVLQLVVPGTTLLFRITLDPDTLEIFRWTLLVLPLVILLARARPDDRAIRAVDFLQGISAALLVTLLIIGSLLLMYRTEVNYLGALTRTFFFIAGLLFGISWLLTPRPGFSGLAQLWQRSVSNIGTPFEQWLTQLSDLYRRGGTPEEFLEASLEELLELPWIAGVKWTAGKSSAGLKGAETQNENDFSFDSLDVSIYSHTPVGASLYLHCRLLVHLIDHFYVAKLKERELTRQTHLSAIFETGARVTHDIKNLLQSLQAITSVVLTDESDASVSGRLLRGQLPHLTQRLQLALDKLQAPAAAREKEVYLKDWWHDLQRRTTQKNVKFQFEVSGDPLIPPDLFDSVIENWLENVREKMQIESGLAITITLFADAHQIQLTLCDSGSRVPEEKAKMLFREPLNSESGLGIGLYQAARQASSAGFRLSLAQNEEGRVCFELARAEPRAEEKIA